MHQVALFSTTTGNRRMKYSVSFPSFSFTGSQSAIGDTDSECSPSSDSGDLDFPSLRQHSELPNKMESSTPVTEPRKMLLHPNVFFVKRLGVGEFGEQFLIIASNRAQLQQNFPPAPQSN